MTKLETGKIDEEYVEFRHEDVAAETVNRGSAGFNKLLLLAAMIVAAASCKEQEHAHAKDFRPVADPNENLCVERTPNVIGYSIFTGSEGRLIPITEDPEMAKLRLSFSPDLLAGLDKIAKQPPEKKEARFESLKKLKDLKYLQNVNKVGFFGEEKIADPVSMPEGFTLSSGPISPEGKVLLWVPKPKPTQMPAKSGTVLKAGESATFKKDK